MENLNRLMGVLEKETEIYSSLLDISKKKKDIIVSGKVNELESLTKGEQTLVLSLGDCEEQLEKAVRDLVAELGINEKDINITVILEYLKGKEKEKLTNQRDILYGIIQELDHMNKLNSQLIKNSLDYINFSVNLFSNANSASSGSYQENGDIKGAKSSFFDVKL